MPDEAPAHADASAPAATPAQPGANGVSTNHVASASPGSSSASSLGSASSSSAAPPVPVEQGASKTPPEIAHGELKVAPAKGRIDALRAGVVRRTRAVVWGLDRWGRKNLFGLGLRQAPGPSAAELERLDIRRAVADKKRAPRVLFIDGNNASRSQMAEAYAITFGLYAESAGTFPRPQLDHFAVAAMAERKLDISAWSPKILAPRRLVAFDRVIVMGDVLPEILLRSGNIEKWNFPLDPQGFPLQGYRLVRDQTERQVRQLAKRLANLKSRRAGAIPAAAQLGRAPDSWKAPEGPAVKYTEVAPPGGVPWSKVDDSKESPPFAP